MTAAARRDVGEDLAAEPLEQLADLARLVLDVGDTAADAARVKVKGQQSPGSRAGIVDRHR